MRGIGAGDFRDRHQHAIDAELDAHAAGHRLQVDVRVFLLEGVVQDRADQPHHGAGVALDLLQRQQLVLAGGRAGAQRQLTVRGLALRAGELAEQVAAELLLDRPRRLARHLGDLALLIHDEGERRRIAVEPADFGAGDLAVGAERAVFVHDVEQHGPLVVGGLLLAGHGMLS